MLKAFIVMTLIGMVSALVAYALIPDIRLFAIVTAVLAIACGIGAEILEWREARKHTRVSDIVWDIMRRNDHDRFKK